jgi:hypothetical protein
VLTSEQQAVLHTQRDRARQEMRQRTRERR